MKEKIKLKTRVKLFLIDVKYFLLINRDRFVLAVLALVAAVARIFYPAEKRRYYKDKVKTKKNIETKARTIRAPGTWK